MMDCLEKLNRVWVVPYSSIQLLQFVDLHNRMLHAYSSTEQDNEGVELTSQFVAMRVLRALVGGRVMDTHIVTAEGDLPVVEMYS